MPYRIKRSSETSAGFIKSIDKATAATASEIHKSPLDVFPRASLDRFLISEVFEFPRVGGIWYKISVTSWTLRNITNWFVPYGDGKEHRLSHCQKGTDGHEQSLPSIG